MGTELKHYIIANIFAATVAAVLGVAVIQIFGGWAQVERSGFYGGVIILGLVIAVAYPAQTLARIFLARRAGITYVSPFAKELRRIADCKLKR